MTTNYLLSTVQIVTTLQRAELNCRLSHLGAQARNVVVYSD